MFESPLWSLAIDAFIVVLGIGWTIIGYLVKNRLERIDTDRSLLETRFEKKLDRYFAEVKSEVVEVEKTALEAKADLNLKFSELPDKYVPRYELQEIVRSMKDTAQHNADGVARMDKKLDHVLLILMEQKKA